MVRQLFSDRLLADYPEFPRTIVLSSHLIDEAANLLELVLIIDRGRIIVGAVTLTTLQGWGMAPPTGGRRRAVPARRYP